MRIEYNAVVIFGGIQPERAGELILAGEDDGFAARFLYAWPDPVPRQWAVEPVDELLLEKALRRLVNLEFAREECGVDGKTMRHHPKVLPLSPEAECVFSEWWIADELVVRSKTGLARSAYGKGPGQVLRLGLVIEFLVWAAGPENEPEPEAISQSAIESALHLVEKFYRPNLLRVLGDAVRPKPERDAAAIAHGILERRCRIVNARHIRHQWGIHGLRKAADVDAAIRELVDADWLILAPERDGNSKGRSRKDYTVNSRVFEGARNND